MSQPVPPGSAAEALGMLRSAMGYLSAADATTMAAETQAQCLQGLEQATAMGTAARASVLAAFTSGQGYCADADYSPRAWLIHKTRITKAAAVSHTAWARRTSAHPQVLAVLAGGQMSESYGRAICTWTDKLPQGSRADADEILLAAAPPSSPSSTMAATAPPVTATARPHQIRALPGRGTLSSRPSSARPSPSYRVRAGWRRSCAAGSSAPGWAGRACRWTSASAATSRPRSAAPSSCGTSAAGSPAAATSPPPPARCIT